MGTDLRDAKQKAADLFSRPGFLVRRLHQAYVAIYLQECEPYGTTPVQSSVLQVLLLHPGLDQISLGGRVGLDRTTTSDVLTRLERRGLIERRAVAEDRRVRRAYLTEDGTTMVCAMQAALDTAHRRLVQALPVDRRQQFVESLLQLVEANEGLERP